MASGLGKVQQIEAVLKARYFTIIPKHPHIKDPAEEERNRLSKALAAFAIEKLSGFEPALSASAVTDDGNDNGIDAVAFDRPAKRLWVVQSKVGDAADLGENKKFCDGITDLVERRWSKFNSHFARLRPEIEAALDTEGLLVVGVQVHLGSALGNHAVSDLAQLKAELNKFFQRFDWKDAGLETVHGWLTSEHAVESPDVTLVLERWSGIENPKRAFYGQVTAAQLAALHHSNGRTLFERNIRDFLGVEGVNEAIAETASHSADDLFYLNNGLTAVCKRIALLPGATPDLASFRLEGFSIVNGAQTVGSVSAAAKSAPLLPIAKLFITLIEIGTATDGIGSRITRARNTQNAVRGLYFVALDPHQERLRQELAISGVTYHYRPSEAASARTPGSITVEQAALALACLKGEPSTLVTAKKDSGQLCDGDGTTYKGLFQASLTGVQLGRFVRVFEYLSDILDGEEATSPAPRSTFFRHGRYMIMNVLARKCPDLVGGPTLELTNAERLELSREALRYGELIWTVAARQHYTKGFLAVFRSATDSIPLFRLVMQEIAKQEAAAKLAGVAPPAATAATTPAITSPDPAVASPPPSLIDAKPPDAPSPGTTA